MIILSAKAYAGPSVIAPAPVVHVAVKVDGDPHWPAGAAGAAATAALLRLLPGLADHPGGDGRAGFPAQLEASPGPPLGLVAARIAAELLRRHGGPLQPAGVRCDSTAERQDSFFGYHNPEIALLAGKLAVYIALALLPAPLRPANNLTERFDPQMARDNFAERAQAMDIDQTAAGIVAEAVRRDIPWLVLDRQMRLVQLGQGRHLRRIRESVTSATPAIATWIEHDKMRTARLLDRLHLPVPRQAIVASAQEAVQKAQSIGLPVVVKPLDSTKGRGITLGINDAAALGAAFDLARRYSARVMVESFIPGEDHRALVVGGRMIAAAKRLPAAVTGDGRRSIAELVEEANRDPRRGRGFRRLMNLIEIDAQADALLGLRGYTRESVPAQGELVVLRGTANISTGGTAIDVTDSVHPDNRAMLERAARVVGLDVAGIDFITPDIARSYREVGGAICEVNSSPGLRPHQIAAQVPGAPPRDVIGPIVELMFPGGGNGRIPIAAITGTNGKTTTSRMLAHILRHAGGELGVRVVGLATTHGVTINDETVAQGDFAGAPGARILLGDLAVEVAVLETARGGILENGIAFDWCDVGAVLNVAADHLGLRGVASLDDLAAAKSCVATAARRLVVLNADDPRCLAMAAPKPPEQVCLFTLEPLDGRLRDAIQRGSLVIGLAERDGRETIHAYRRDGSDDLIATGAMPATLGGAARHNVQNAMAAAGLALGLGLSPAGVAAALAAFRGDHSDNPGRLNLIEGFPFTILHDAAHNPHGMRMACAALRSLPVTGRRICVITGVGYRHGEHIEEIAEVIAGEFDVFLCSRLEQIRRPSLVKRDFPLEEVPARLAAALIARGVDPDRVQTIDLDKDAVDRGLQMARDGDLLVLFTGLVAWTRERVLQFGAATTADAAADAGEPLATTERR